MRLAQRHCQKEGCKGVWVVHLSGWLSPERKAELHQPSNKCPVCGTKWVLPPAPPMTPEEQAEWDRFREAMPIRDANKGATLIHHEITENKPLSMPKGDILTMKMSEWDFDGGETE